MRRRLSWAVLGTSGVLAAILGAAIASGGADEQPGSKIIVPVAADDAGLDLSRTAETEPSTVFIATVPPVAVTSTVTPPPPPPPARPAISQPSPAVRPPAGQKTTSTKPAPVKAPVQTVRRSIWDIYAAYLRHYSTSTGHRYGDHYRDGDRYRYGDRRDGRGGR